MTPLLSLQPWFFREPPQRSLHASTRTSGRRRRAPSKIQDQPAKHSKTTPNLATKPTSSTKPSRFELQEPVCAHKPEETIDRFQTWNHATILKEQSTDVFCTKVISDIHNSNADEERYFIDPEDGLLKRYSYQKTTYTQLVVPASLVPTLLTHYHCLPLAAHMGQRKCTQTLNRKYWWPNFREDIKAFIRGCLPCARRKSPRHFKFTTRGNLNVNGPFERVAIDLVGPFKHSHQGDSKWILTYIDSFTRWCGAVPIPSKSTEHIIEALEKDLVSIHGFPESLHSDNEVILKSHELKDWCRIHNVTQTFTSGYNPQGNGQVEVFHRYFSAALTMLCNKYKTDFERWIPAVLFAHRASTHTTTGYSPFELVFGRRPSLPLDNAWRHRPPSANSEYAHIHDMKSRLQTLYDEVRTAQQRMSDRNARANIHPTRELCLQKDDLVLVWQPKIQSRASNDPDQSAAPKKLSYRWHGPYRVIGKAKYDQLWEIQMENNTTNTVHQNRLFHFNPWSEDCLDVSFNPNNHETPTPHEPKYIFRHEAHHLTPGDMICFPLTTSTVGEQPFGIGQYISTESDGNIKFQWFSSLNASLRGPYRNAWVDSNFNVYYRKTQMNKRDHAFTGDRTDTSINVHNIAFFRFKLLSNGLLPTDLVKDIVFSESIAASDTDIDNVKQDLFAGRS